MKHWRNLIKRAWALILIRSLEIELHDRTNAMALVPYEEIAELCRSRRRIQGELLRARQQYIATLPPGTCPTWRTS